MSVSRVLLSRSLALLAIGLLGCGSGPAAEERSNDATAALEVPAERPLRAGFLIVDGVYNTELTAPFDILQHTIYHTQPGIEVFTVSPDGELVTTAEGLRILPDHSFASAPSIDILVVPSAEHSRDDDRANTALIDWVRTRGSESRFSLSFCWGAFILAEAGLLDGRSATTFPSDYQRFAESFAEVDLRVNVSFVHDGGVLTSEGGTRSFDAAMYLVDLLYGEEVARGVGAGLLIPWPPSPSGRPSYISDPSMTRRRAAP